jgi:hypothetical protein
LQKSSQPNKIRGDARWARTTMLRGGLMAIKGVDGMSPEQIRFEIQRGARFVIFQYCISAVIITFRRPSDIYLIRGEESALSKGLPFTLLTVLLGWWGIPWGPIFSVQSLITNFRGGKNVTTEIMSQLPSQVSQVTSAPPISPA